MYRRWRSRLIWMHKTNFNCVGVFVFKNYWASVQELNLSTGESSSADQQVNVWHQRLLPDMSYSSCLMVVDTKAWVTYWKCVFIFPPTLLTLKDDELQRKNPTSPITFREDVALMSSIAIEGKYDLLRSSVNSSFSPRLPCASLAISLFSSSHAPPASFSKAEVSGWCCSNPPASHFKLPVLW